MKKNEVSGGRKDYRNGKREREFKGTKSNIQKHKMKKNIQRLGGKGLSLEAFANIKARNKDYNPAIIKKQKEFYKNAKLFRKYKKLAKEQREHNEPVLSMRSPEDETGTEKTENSRGKYLKTRKNNARNLEELYAKKHEEEEKARLERETAMEAMKEERQRAEGRRKELRERMFKKTRSGQPVMKYRIEHLLETIQGSKS